MDETSLQNGRFTLISRLGEDGGMHMHVGVRQTVVRKRARLAHANIVRALDYAARSTEDA